jgi:hypothetical protein
MSERIASTAGEITLLPENGKLAIEVRGALILTAGAHGQKTAGRIGQVKGKIPG